MQMEAPLISNVCVCFSAISLPLISPPHPFSSLLSALGALTFAPCSHGFPCCILLCPPPCLPLMCSPLLHLSLLLHINISGDKLLPPAHLFLCTNL